MPLDPRIDAFLKSTSFGTMALELHAIRAATERNLLQLQGPPEPVSGVLTCTAPGHGDYPIRVRIYRPAAAEADERLPALVFAHGGGWFQGSLELYDSPCRALANATGCAVLSVDYRLAPEHRFPVPAEDFYAAVTWAFENADALSIDPTRIGVAGDSAGGNLAAAATIMARDRGGPALAHQLLIYPVVDHAFTTESYRKYGQNFLLTEQVMRYCWFTYLINARDGDSPYASPLRLADMRGLPPATVLVCEYDPLHDEGRAYAARLRDAGISVHEAILPGMIHACIHMTGLTNQARCVFDSAARGLQAFVEGDNP